MAEDEDLEVLRALVDSATPAAGEETDEGEDDEVEEGQRRPIVRGCPIAIRGFRPPRASLELGLKALVTLYVVINPAGLAAGFVSLAGERSAKVQATIARRAVLSPEPSLLLFSVVGGPVLTRLHGPSLSSASDRTLPNPEPVRHEA